jgi:hypothetical protein
MAFLHWQLEVSLVALGRVVVASRPSYIENIARSPAASAVDIDAFDTFALRDLKTIED